MAIGIGGAIIASSAISAGAGIGGGLLGGMGAPSVPTTQPWQYGLSMLLNMPGYLNSLRLMRESREMAQRWRTETNPARYAERGWLMQGSPNAGVQGRVETGVTQWLNGDVATPYGGLFAR